MQSWQSPKFIEQEGNRELKKQDSRNLIKLRRRLRDSSLRRQQENKDEKTKEESPLAHSRHDLSPKLSPSLLKNPKLYENIRNNGGERLNTDVIDTLLYSVISDKNDETQIDRDEQDIDV